MTRVAINGFGRIGRNFLRAWLDKSAGPERPPWRELGIDVVVESTGRFAKREKAEAHLDIADLRESEEGT